MSKTSVTVRRVTANLRERDEQNLAKIAEMSGVSRNDAIRKALASEVFIQKALSEGGSILIRDAKGEIREVHFVG